jgi:signal transduction histidine kinase
MLGGDLVLDSEPGQGVQIWLTIPCEQCREREEAAMEVQELWA